MESHGTKPPAPGEADRQAARAKKAYRTPRLTEYGNVAKLTQANAGSGADSGMKASQMMTCL